MKHLAIIPGDGIGKEVIDAGLEVLDAVAEISTFEYDGEIFDIGRTDTSAPANFLPTKT